MGIQKQKPISELAKTLSSKKKSEEYSNFKVSFEDYDSSQKYSSSFRDWQSCGLLSTTLELLQGYCKRPLQQQLDGKKFALYGDFPKKDETLYKYPTHVTPDAKWARIHINNVSVIIGHVIGDTFYVVFLDKTHKFWLTKRIREN